MGKALAVKAGASILVFGSMWLMLEYFLVPYYIIYTLFGGIGIVIVLTIWFMFPQFESKTEQHKHLVLRKSYWLYYLLTFLSGARRQIIRCFCRFFISRKI